MNMIEHQYLEARQLWYRIPDFLKNELAFQSVWSILKHLWKYEIRLALQMISSTQWPNEYINIMESLQKSIREKHIELISKVYRNMPQDGFCSILSLTFDEAELSKCEVLKICFKNPFS